MRRKSRTEGAISKSADNPIVPQQPQFCFEGDDLSSFLKAIHREIELARAVETTLPPKFWIKQQFAVGVNEVTRTLERMTSDKIPSEIESKANCIHLQAILIASDCNPRWLTKHLPALAASRNVSLIFIKDKREGSLRLGELIKLKTAIAIGIKAKGNAINQIVKEVLAGDRTNSIEA